jgi:glycogen debranching enzyme
VEYAFACDFADQFEVRGARRRERGAFFRPLVDKDKVTWLYQGRDAVLYRTEVCFPLRAPDEVGPGRARFRFHLGPNETASLELHAAPSMWTQRSGASVRESADAMRAPGARQAPLLGEEPEGGFLYPGSAHLLSPPAARPYEERVTEARADYRRFAESSTSIRASEASLNGTLQQAVADLKALNIVWDGRRVVSAGIPWYGAPFGRDALITGFQALLVNPDIARDALLFLAAHQGRKVDDFREEEPGKILHEIRRGELARTGEVPHTPYYGSVDSTPLFIILFTEYLQWTDDRSTGEELLPAAEAALHWIDEFGDKDGDGFIEYERKTPRGLQNQGWKDSHDGIPHKDGTPAKAPIALVEVQGYCVDAQRRMARLYRRLGRREEAARCALAAQKLARRLDEAFWMEKEGCYAIALDGEKRQVQSVASNQGHLLWSRALPEARARRVARTLLDPASFSGWGIRTLASGQHAYNPLSYHNGTVWPHDNSLIAQGLANYGLQKHVAALLTGLSEAARQFRHDRLPELFCGMERGQRDLAVSYPVSCSPQAWSSGALFLLVRACLGLFPDAPRKTLKIVNPQLSPWLHELTLSRLRVGRSHVSLHFTRTREGCFAAITESDGEPLAVRIEVGAQRDAQLS